MAKTYIVGSRYEINDRDGNGNNITFKSGFEVPASTLKKFKKDSIKALIARGDLLLLPSAKAVKDPVAPTEPVADPDMVANTGNFGLELESIKDDTKAQLYEQYVELSADSGLEILSESKVTKAKLIEILTSKQ